VHRGFFVTEDDYLERALELARLGRRLAHPNPRVGAVVVADGEVVGEGYHRGPGTPHAEAVALEQAGERARGAALYVTLEPCCRQGHTGPCTEKILAAGVGRVVVGATDPNPAVDGRGLAALRAAGVEVALDSGALHTLCEQLNEPFARFIRSGLPFVTFKAAVSLDGKVAAAGGDGRWISSPESRRQVHQMRAAADAVMVGAGTARRDDPLLTARDADGPDPVRVVVSRTGDLPVEARLSTTARECPTILLTASIDPERELALAASGVEVVRAAGLRDGLAQLARRGLVDILCEGGPTLAGALLAEGLVDRLVVFVAPLVLGRGAPDLVALPAPTAVAQGLALADVVWTSAGSDMVCRGRVVKRTEAGAGAPLVGEAGAGAPLVGDALGPTPQQGSRPQPPVASDGGEGQASCSRA
jgi:diaminohydroxyphosphoribosylaminopyrimidine deaminase/5-amino-6-(5-phosphoribosylamino)uracil reductase